MSGRPGLIIASPTMEDPNFQRTVVLVCQHDEKGALGLVINRPGEVDIIDVLLRLELDGPLTPDGRTWWGGPVGPGTGFVVWRGQAADEEGWTIGDEVAVSPAMERLRERVASGQPYALVLGYAGWAPGQLDAEIASGSWLFADADPDLVFDLPAGQRYDAALARLGVDPERVWMHPVDE
jgi:putative transcriptional regulator